MSGKYEPRWSTRQRLVVLTFDTPQQAHVFDLRGGGRESTVEPMGGFDISLVDSDHLDTLLWEVRQFIDAWDDGENRLGGQDLNRLEQHVRALRVSLFELRQAALT